MITSRQIAGRFTRRVLGKPLGSGFRAYASFLRWWGLETADTQDRGLRGLVRVWYWQLWGQRFYRWRYRVNQDGTVTPLDEDPGRDN
jgi:hypothetical protein